MKMFTSWCQTMRQVSSQVSDLSAMLNVETFVIDILHLECQQRNFSEILALS